MLRTEIYNPTMCNLSKFKKHERKEIVQKGENHGLLSLLNMPRNVFEGIIGEGMDKHFID